MKNLLKISLFLLLSFCNFNANAQTTHEWVETGLIKPRQGINNFAYSQALNTDSFSNTYLIGTYIDTLYIDSHKLLPAFSNAQNGFIAKFSDEGNLLWSNTFYMSNGNAVNLQSVKVANSNSIFVSGTFYASSNAYLRLTSKDSILASGHTGFIAIYDSTGNLIKAKKTFDNSGSTSYLDLSHDQFIYQTFLVFNSTKIYDYNGSKTITGQKYGLIKYSVNLDTILWVKYFPSAYNFTICNMNIGIDNNIYIIGKTTGGSFSLNGVNYNFGTNFFKSFLIILDPQGNYLYAKPINADLNSQDNLLDVAAIDTNMFFYWVRCLTVLKLAKNGLHPILLQ